MNGWQALLGRITFFLAPSSVIMPSAFELFRKLWNVEPKSYQGSLSPFSASVAHGRSEDLSINCAVHPARIDLNLSAGGRGAIPGPQYNPGIQDGAQLSKELKRLFEVIERNVLANPVLRVALYLQFICFKKDWAEANSELLTVVPDHYRVKLADEQEFSIQANKPCASKQVENVKLNRITKWSSDHITIIAQKVESGQMGELPSKEKPAAYDFFGASVLFDNNNVPIPTERPLTSAEQSKLLLELFGYALGSMKDFRLKIRGFDND